MGDQWAYVSQVLGFDARKLNARLMPSLLPYPQRDDVSRRLSELAALPLGWDGYTGKPVTAAVAEKVHAVLATCLAETGRHPSLVPGPSGDVQLEWHWGGVDIEVMVTESQDIHVWIDTSALGECGETKSFTPPAEVST